MKNKNEPFGYIDLNVSKNELFVKYDLDEGRFKTTSDISLSIVAPKRDVMQYFMQWQRYRKYWWSLVTTTPSLFTTSDTKDDEKTATASIIVNFNWGTKPVETVTMDLNTDNKISSIICKMTLEEAILILLLDGISNKTKEDYLRLHNKIAPYKIAFAIDCQDSKLHGILKELTELITYKLKVKTISTRCPNTFLPLRLQLQDNFEMGVPYTAILTEGTLSNGIFHLLNSSTMLKEQVHLIDFESYAELLCCK